MCGIVGHIAIDVDVPASEFNWIFGDEATPGWIVIAVAVIQEPGAVILTSGELESVVGGGAGDLGGPIRVIAVARQLSDEVADPRGETAAAP